MRFARVKLRLARIEAPLAANERICMPCHMMKQIDFMALAKVTCSVTDILGFDASVSPRKVSNPHPSIAIARQNGASWLHLCTQHIASTRLK